MTIEAPGASPRTGPTPIGDSRSRGHHRGRLRVSRLGGSLTTVLFFALLLGGCESDSPTAPSVPPPAASPGSGSASVAWNITVSADPNIFDATELAETGFSSRITVTAQRVDNGQPVPQNATALLSASAGTLTSGSSAGATIPITFGIGGRAFATLTPPLQPGNILIQAQLESTRTRE